jgi:hypothetical protein
MRRYRTIAGATAGLLAWAACRFGLGFIPAPLAFYLTAVIFTFGCGALPLMRLVKGTPLPARTALACAFGLAVAPAVMYGLALIGGVILFPALAFAAAGAAAAWWVRRGDDGDRVPAPADGIWYVVVPLAIAATIFSVGSGRIRATADSLAIYGDYDTLDLAYYASIASELGHTRSVPPQSPFYAGHHIVYSYFPLLFLVEVQKFSGVRLIEAFLKFGWPFFGAVAAGGLLAFYRRLGSIHFAVLSTLLTFTGSTLAYVAAWQWPEMVGSDRLIWSSLFLAPSAEWLFFNPWTPSLVVLAVGLYALTRLPEDGGVGWLIVASVCFGHLFMFKSFAFPIVVAAVGMAALLALIRRERIAWPLFGVAAGSVLLAAPWILAVVPYNRLENRGALLSIEYFSLVRRMLFKADLTDPLLAFVHRYIGSDPSNAITLLLASLIFLLGGLNARVLGVVGLCKAAVGRASMRPWTPLAWMAILGIAIPFVIAIAPFPNSIQPHLFGLLVLWPFAVYVVWPPGARPTRARWTATAAIVACSVPSTWHYGRTARDAPAQPPIVSIGPGDYRILRYLERTDPNTTMILHSETLWPSLYAIESRRRVVLALSSYVEGDGSADVTSRLSEIAGFFGSPAAEGVADVSILARYHVTHVIERLDRDRIHPAVVRQLHLVTGTPNVRLYEVPQNRQTDRGTAAIDSIASWAPAPALPPASRH